MTSGDAVHLTGSPEARGRAQAQAARGIETQVRNSVLVSLKAASDDLSRPDVAEYLAAQRRFSEKHAVRHMEELQGIAEGFGLHLEDVFAYLHLSFLTPRPLQLDGCSTIALGNSQEGPLVGKNRDYRGEHHALQRVFIHEDPQFPEKRCLCVGSLGAPGAFSSGMNSKGLALADTRIAWPRPGVGWLRYFLMTEVLWQTDTVADAVALIRSVPHVGGGSIALADASGNVASVELGSEDVAVQMSETGGFVHTNHFVYEPLAGCAGPAATDATSQSSLGRLAVLSEALTGIEQHACRDDIRDLLSRHGQADRCLCRHADGSEEFTISSAIYSCRERSLSFSAGNPCRDEWRTYRL